MAALEQGRASGAGTVNTSGKGPAPPRFAGVRGDGNITVNTWLMQFADR